MIEIDASGGLWPLGMRPERFLQEFWQKKPLLVRNALPGFRSPLQPEDLAGLACEDGALARIVSRDPATDSWTIENGPFAEDSFPGRPDHDWTLLVQDVDKWDADVRDLLGWFRFLPAWRMDDIMVSFAAPGGSVGAHIDNYDVFLLQAQGHRRWQIDTRKRPDATWREDVPLRLLKHFNPNRDWVLGPGDMLYLPPGVPHHGIAVDACLTISVGLRAPSSAELLEDYAMTLSMEADEGVRYADPDLAFVRDPWEIDNAAVDRAIAALQQLKLRNRAQHGEWFGRFITRYRVADGMAPDAAEASDEDIVASLRAGRTWIRHPYSRMAWRKASDGQLLFANGECFETEAGIARTLCPSDAIDHHTLDAIGPEGVELLRELARRGHYHPVDADDEAD